MSSALQAQGESPDTLSSSRKGAGASSLGGDDRYKMLDATMKRHRFAPDALIEVLHTAQELFGFLDRGVLSYVARGLRLPPSRVYGVATFYHFFTFKPRGRHTCVVCTGTACYVKGGERLIRAANEFVDALETDAAEDLISVSEARCLGACGLAPVVVLDGAVSGQLSPEAILARLEAWKTNGS